MKLTKKLMWKIVIELWEWMEETGSAFKSDWPGWEKYGFMYYHCPFCEYYRTSSHDDCSGCPIDFCDNHAFGDWNNANTDADRKKYAGLFLEQLKEERKMNITEQINAVVDAREKAREATNAKVVTFVKWEEEHAAVIKVAEEAEERVREAEALLRELTLQDYAETGNKARL